MLPIISIYFISRFNSVENKKIVLFSDFVYNPSVDLNVLFKNLESSHINVSIM